MFYGDRVLNFVFFLFISLMLVVIAGLIYAGYNYVDTDKELAVLMSSKDLTHEELVRKNYLQLKKDGQKNNSANSMALPLMMMAMNRPYCHRGW